MSAARPFAPDVAAPSAPRLRLRLRGAVQGVGMRPRVHALATGLGLAGFVLNDAEGVLVEVEGAAAPRFAAALVADPPPLARIDAIEAEPMPSRGETGFAIRESRTGARAATRVPADAATCDACLADLFDPASRFFHYPFVSCTHCGPRHTIALATPYDRARTTMAGFPLCPDCARDYADPSNRRFHAEPIACPACGPRLSHPVSTVAAALAAGRIVALKGVGGFHLMCDARCAAAVDTLRARKQRDAKPFAVMAPLAAIAAFAAPTEAERVLLRRHAAPIVLVAARPGVLAPGVSPGLRHIGVVLPYAPLHHLLFAALPPGFALVATSANPGGEPLVIDGDDARRRLAGIADLVVDHDRPIATRLDDSVMAIVDGAPAFLRRARGFVPEPIDLGADGPPVLALGAHLKNTVCVTRGREAFVSQHVGDLDTAETRRFFDETIAHLLAVLDVNPAAVACDLHPDYHSSRAAETFARPVLRVQHHAAHIAAVAAEHRLDDPVFGLALDGHGLGVDGGAWGGEALWLEGAAARRLGRLAPLALPGGDRAAREPWRMGLAALARLGRLDDDRFAAEPLAAALAARLAAGAVTGQTSSVGRLFDAASALLGLRPRQHHEGQAAMELEALVDTPRVLPCGWTLRDGELDLLPLLAALARPGLAAGEGAALFHGTLAAALVDWTRVLAPPGAVVALGGGCLMNRVLAGALADGLRAAGFRPFLARAVPPNDGGLSLGQAALARRMLAPERHEPRNPNRAAASRDSARSPGAPQEV